MSQFVAFAVLGIATGSLYALLGLGLTVVYRSSGVVNFSHGGIALVAAYLYFDLTTRGWPNWVGAVTGIASGMLLGLLIYLLTVRPLRAASGLTKAIATLAVLVMLQSIVTLRYGSAPLTVNSFVPAHPIDLLGTSLPLEDLIIFGVCLLMVIGLTVVYRSTRFGIATTAVAESEFAVALLGRSSTVIAATNWTIGCGLAALAGITIAPLAAISPAQSSALLIPALAVALCGRFNSFPAMFLGSLVVGIGQAELSYYSTQWSMLNNITGLSEALPFLLIVLIVTFRNRALPSRDFIASAMPKVGSASISRQWSLFWVGLAALLIATLSDIWVIALTAGLISAVMLLSLVVVTGYAGQLSLAQVSIAGVGVLVASYLVQSQSWPMPIAALAGIAATVPVALLVGLPALRTRGVMLGVVTLGLAHALNAVLFQRSDINGLGAGITVGPATFAGIELDPILHPRAYAVFTLVILALTATAVANLRRSPIGKQLLAVRSNERAAAALGIRVTVVKLYAFCVAGVIAGIAGILAAWQVPNVLLNRGYDPLQSVNAAVSGTLAGVGYISGAILGGSAVTPGAIGGQMITNIGFGEYLALISGALLLGNIVFNPHGLVPNTLTIAASARSWLQAQLRRSKPTPRSDVSRRMAAAFLAGDDAERAVTSAGPGMRPTAAAASNLELEVNDLRVVFGATKAVDGVSLGARGGEVIGIIGPNGSGKTTLIDAVSGFVQATGTVVLDGHDLGSTPAYARNRAGISRSFQSLELFEELTVADNLLVASAKMRWTTWLLCLVWPGRARATAAVREGVAEFGLDDSLARKPAELPYGKRRLLAICRALSTAALPKVLLLDEPAAGLGDTDRAELRRLIRNAAEKRGMIVLLVEHDVELVMDVSDRVIVLEFGKKIAEGLPSEVRTHPDVIRSYLGAPEESLDIATTRSVDHARTLMVEAP
jgi:ABC-type branched-subunit amino acid transport system ATPase component/branched-subunit amino acid ABC-type transport system permease component